MFIFSIILAVREFGFDVNTGAVAAFFIADLSRNLSFRSARKAVGSDDVRTASIDFITAQTFVNRAKRRGVIRTLGHAALQVAGKILRTAG